MTTPLSSMLYVLFASFIGSFGAVFLKGGADRLRFHWLALVSNWRLPLGVFFFLSASYFFVLGVKDGELSVLYPMVSLGYMWTMVWSRLFFKEAITRTKLLGLAAIFAGIFFVGLGSR